MLAIGITTEVSKGGSEILVLDLSVGIELTCLKIKGYLPIGGMGSLQRMWTISLQA